MSEKEPVMYVPCMDAYLNRWFVRYDEARTSLEKQGGYLLPYRDHFFVSTAGAIRELGLDPEDPDWRAIGWDWVRPADPETKKRLLEKRQLVI